MVTKSEAVRSARGRFASHKRNTAPHPSSVARHADHSATSSFSFANDSSTPHDESAFSDSKLLLSADLSAGRPPSKLAVTLPYGILQQTINGVRTDLKFVQDGEQSAANSTQTGIQLVPQTPATSVTTDKQKRVLRSQDAGPRTRSDLARFFPDYEEVLFGTPQPTDYITAKSSLFIVEKKFKFTETLAAGPHTSCYTDEDASTAIPTNISAKEEASLDTHATPIQNNEIPIFSFDTASNKANEFMEDPLSEAYFFKAHRRGERREKQLRNIEKEHAMHEKLDLDRLFEELRGPDWAKTMGLAGVVDANRKNFELKRDYYISAIRILLDKFRSWKDQEKELKARKEAALAAHYEDDEEHDHMDTVSDQATLDDVDLSALQLRQEAGLPVRVTPKKIKLRLNFAIPEEDPSKPFVSFYAKPYQRAAALSSHRRGRNPTAFGQPIPDCEEAEFALPDGYITEEIMTANARKRRRLKRESKT